MIKEINKLKKGDYFRFPNKKKIYVFNGYNRFSRKYHYSSVNDIWGSDYGKKKGTLVQLVDY